MTITDCGCDTLADQGESLPTKETEDGTTSVSKWSGPIGMEDHRTGDGRLIKLNALRWEGLPIPLRHVASDHGAHDGAVVVGRIDEIERLSFEEANERLEATGRDPLADTFSDATIIWGIGVHDLGSEAGREAKRLVKEGYQPGISMDLDDVVIEDEDAESFSILEGRVRAATGVAIPAFDGARIAVDEASVEQLDTDDEQFNWVEDAGGLPQYIKRISKHLEKKGMLESHAIATAVNVVKKMCATGDLNFPGAQQVNAGSRTEACAAVAEWEAKKASANASSGETIVASAAKVFKAEWFKDPHLKEPTALVVTDEGRIFGHIAAWDTCHVAHPQGRSVCTQPPRSRADYAYFRTGAVATDTGEVAVGRITMNTLHAGPRLNNIDAQHHYEHTGAVGAYVNVGEDSYGIWIAGAAHPDADLTTLKAAPISGDWRTVRGNLELVSALSVNIPGFPVPRPQALVASGKLQSLVASGMIEPTNRQSLDLDDDQILALRERFRAMDNKEKAANLAAKVSRADALHRVRRMAAYTQQFGYDENQWRMPKGNPNAGQWIDMPDMAIEGLVADIEALVENPGNLNDKEAALLGPELDKVINAGGKISAAIRAGDGPEANASAAPAVEALSKIEAQLQVHADNGTISEEDAVRIGDKLEAAQSAVSAVADNDLSLLGDKGIGGDDESSDIGGADDKVAPEATDIGADAPEAPEASEGPGATTEELEVPLDWSERWPGTDLEPGDQVRMELDEGGDLVDLEVTRDGEPVDTSEMEGAELSALFESANPSGTNPEAPEGEEPEDRGEAPAPDANGLTPGEAKNAEYIAANDALTTKATATNLKTSGLQEKAAALWSDYYRSHGQNKTPPSGGIQVNWGTPRNVSKELMAHYIGEIHADRLKTDDPDDLKYLDDLENMLREAAGGKLPDGTGSFVLPKERKYFEDATDIFDYTERSAATARFRDADGYEWSRIGVEGGSGDWRVKGPNGEHVDIGWDSDKIDKVAEAVEATKQAVANGDDYEVIQGGMIVPKSWGEATVGEDGRLTFNLPDGSTIEAGRGTGIGTLKDPQGNDVIKNGSIRDIKEATAGGGGGGGAAPEAAPEADAPEGDDDAEDLSSIIESIRTDYPEIADNPKYAKGPLAQLEKSLSDPDVDRSRAIQNTRSALIEGETQGRRNDPDWTPEDSQHIKNLTDELNALDRPADAPEGDTPGDMQGVTDALLDAGIDADIVDKVGSTGYIQDPEAEADSPGVAYEDVWDVLRALPEGTEIRTGQEPIHIDWKKDSSAEGGWSISEVGPGLADEGFEVGGDMEGDPSMIDGGGDNDIYIKGNAPEADAPSNPNQQDSDDRDNYWNGWEASAKARGRSDESIAEARKEFDKTLDEGGTIDDAFEAARGPDTKEQNANDAKDRDNYWEGFKSGLTPEEEEIARPAFDDVLDNGGSILDAMEAAREARDNGPAGDAAEPGSLPNPPVLEEAGYADITDEPGTSDGFAGASRVYEHSESGMVIAEGADDGQWQVIDQETGTVVGTEDTPEAAKDLADRHLEENDYEAPEADAPEAEGGGETMKGNDPDVWDKLDALPAGSTVESDDGEYPTTLTKQEDGSWLATESTLEDNVGYSTAEHGKDGMTGDDEYPNDITVKSVGDGPANADPGEYLPPVTYEDRPWYPEGQGSDATGDVIKPGDSVVGIGDNKEKNSGKMIGSPEGSNEIEIEKPDGTRQKVGGGSTVKADSTPEGGTDVADRPDNVEPQGSPQQQASVKSVEATGQLERTLMDVMDSPDSSVSADDSAMAGEALESFYEALAKVNAGIEDGNYNAADLTAAKSALSKLEATLMDVADRPGLTDKQANQIGTALDDVFDSVGSLEGLLKGEMNPPPFANMHRSYARQWLGRKGFRISI